MWHDCSLEREALISRWQILKKGEQHLKSGVECKISTIEQP